MAEVQAYGFRIAYANPNERGGIYLVVQNRDLPKPHVYRIRPEDASEFRKNLGVNRTRDLRGKWICGAVEGEGEDAILKLLFKLQKMK